MCWDICRHLCYYHYNQCNKHISPPKVSLCPFALCVCVCVWKTLEIYPPNNFLSAWYYLVNYGHQFVQSTSRLTHLLWLNVHPLNNSSFSPHPTHWQPIFSFSLLKFSALLSSWDTSCKWNCTEFAFCGWCISLGVMPSRSIHVVTNFKMF